LAAKGVHTLNPNRSPDDPQDQSLADLLRPDKMPPQRLDETSIVSFWMSNSRKFYVPRDHCVPPSMRTPDDKCPHPSECGTVRAGVGTETAHAISDDDTGDIILQLVVHILFTCCSHVVHMLFTCCSHLTTCWPHVVYLLRCPKLPLLIVYLGGLFNRNIQ
jgi:hypothetical protein